MYHDVEVHADARPFLGEVQDGGVEEGADVGAEVGQADEGDGGEDARWDAAVGAPGRLGDDVEDVEVDGEDGEEGRQESECEHNSWKQNGVKEEVL